MRRRRPQPASATRPAYPDKQGFDPSRRRFMRQVGVAAGATGLLAAVGLPQLAHGQSQPVDFSVLDAHPGREVLVPSNPSAPLVPAQPPAMVPPPAPTPPASPSEVVATLVTEDRALWIEPGYLLLVRWSRPADNTDVIAAFEGTTADVSVYLQSHVTSRNSLHDVDQLHVMENDLAALLEARIAPASLVTLHLDHDCTQVCSMMGWGEELPDHPVPPGMMPPPSYKP